MSGPPPLAPVPGLTPANNYNTKKRKPSGPPLNPPPNKKPKPTPGYGAPSNLQPYTSYYRI